MQEPLEDLVEAEALVHVRAAFLLKLLVLGDLGLPVDALDLVVLVDHLFESLVQFSLQVGHQLRLLD